MASRGHLWGPLYVALGVSLIVVALLLRGSGYVGSAQLHIVLESMATLLALVVGLVAFVNYYMGHSSRFLFMGSGFVAAALLDGYHTVIAGGGAALVWPSAPDALGSWSWYPSRLLLALLLLVSWRAWSRNREEGGLPVAREWVVHLVVALMTVASFALFAFVNLPPAYQEGGLLGRPQELLSGIIFLSALGGYLQQGRWRQAVFEQWVVVFLILSVAIQFLFMPFSRVPYDASFDAAHYLKIASYGSVLVGLLLNIHHVFARARRNAQALEALNRDLEQRVRQRTADLKASELRFRNLFAANPHPMFVYDTETLHFLEANAAAVADYGYSREEWLAMRLTDIRPEEDGPALKEALDGERPALSPSSEWRHRLKDGRVIDVEISSHELTYQERPARLVVARDITEREAAIERRRAQQLLTQREERFRALVQRAMDMITILGPDGSILYDSPAVERVLGYDTQERLGENALSYVHPEDAQLVRQRIADVAQEPGKTARVEVRVRHKSGSWRVVEATGRNMVHHPAIQGIVVNWHDITELREAAQALDERKRILRSVLDSMAEGVIVADDEGAFLLFNRAARNLLGVGARQTGPDGWSATYNLHYPGETTLAPTEELPLVRALQGETVDDVDLYVQNPERPGGIYIRTSARPLVDESGRQQGGLAVFVDITAQRRAERAIRELNAQLEERVRQRTAQLQEANRELEAFAYSVSHDLRAPLRAMDGFSRILIEEFDDAVPAAAQRYLQRIRRNAQQMGRLIDDLLTFSRLSRRPLETRPVQPEELAREALRELSGEQEGRQVEISVHALPQVEADPRLLKLVFVNLLDNALKYTRSRESARIEVGVEESDDDSAAPVFYVRDNGMGFDMKYAHKLFGVFQRLHTAEEYEGTGVGLATAQRIVQRHGGRVWAEAQVDEGATFYFTIGEAL